jgi:hypothetical protein
LLLLTASATAEPIHLDSYDAWQWNGFARTAGSPLASVGGSVVPSLLADSVSSSSSSAAPISLINYLTTGNSAQAAAADLTGSISGYVFVDTNGNGIMDASDWAISGATLQLSTQGSTAVTIAYSKPDGSYTFTGLGAGTYSVTMLTPCSYAWETYPVGVLQDAAGNAVVPAGVAAADQFTDIAMPAGGAGTNYNFGNSVFPVAAYSKRLLIDDNGIIHTVPEPGSLVLLAVGGLILAGFARLRRS